IRPLIDFCHDSVKAFAIWFNCDQRNGTQLHFPRQVAALATASLLIAGAFFVSLLAAADARAEALSGTCEDAAEIAVLAAPMAPWKGAPLRVIVAAEKPLE